MENSLTGKRIRYSKDMNGSVIEENNTHILIKFDSGTKYCVRRSCIETKNIVKNE